jgi:hypothetical protein
MSNPFLTQDSTRQNGLYQFVLGATFARCRRLKILVCDTEIRVPHVVANCELVLAHFGEHGSNRVSEGMPTHQPAFSLAPVLPVSPILANKVAFRTEVSDTRVDEALAPEYCCCRGQSDQYSVRSETTVYGCMGVQR